MLLKSANEKSKRLIHLHDMEKSTLLQARHNDGLSGELFDYFCSLFRRCCFRNINVAPSVTSKRAQLNLSLKFYLH